MGTPNFGPIDVSASFWRRPITATQREAISAWLKRHAPECRYFLADWRDGRPWARLWHGPGKGTGPWLDMSIALEVMEKT